jgi:SAM-dependent methyltransferase
VHLLPDVSGLDTLELGCGTAYVSAWLMRRGAQVIGLDNSANQLATARLLQAEFGLGFPLVHADAECLPFADKSFDFAISQYGAATWCDPYQWIPEASRILRVGGRLLFETGSPLVMCCYPTDDDEAPADSRLHRDYFGMHRFEWRGPNGAVRGHRVQDRARRHGPTPALERLRDRGPDRNPATQRRCRLASPAVHPAGVGAALAECRGVEGAQARLTSRVYIQAVADHAGARDKFWPLGTYWGMERHSLADGKNAARRNATIQLVPAPPVSSAASLVPMSKTS